MAEVPGKEPSIRGVDAGRARRAIERALSALEPMPSVDIETVRVDSSDVVVVGVKPSMTAPVLAQGVAYTRLGEARAATANKLVERVGPSDSAEDLRQMLEQFGQAIEQQGKLIEKLLADSGLRAQAHLDADRCRDRDATGLATNTDLWLKASPRDSVVGSSTGGPGRPQEHDSAERRLGEF